MSVPEVTPAPAHPRLPPGIPGLVLGTRPGLSFFVAGVLITGGLAGLLLNRTGTQPALEQPVSADSTASVSPAIAATAVTQDVERTSDEAPPLPVSPVRPVALTPPSNPFRPSAPDSALFVFAPRPAPRREIAPRVRRAHTRPLRWPGRDEPGPDGDVPFLPPVDGSAAASRTEPAATAAPVAPQVGDIALTGVVQGDPPIAVVRYGGQSHFLKIGDQVADTWRLVEVRERSAILQVGGRRVEIQIRGGSSQ